MSNKGTNWKGVCTNVFTQFEASKNAVISVMVVVQTGKPVFLQHSGTDSCMSFLHNSRNLHNFQSKTHAGMVPFNWYGTILKVIKRWSNIMRRWVRGGW